MCRYRCLAGEGQGGGGLTPGKLTISARAVDDDANGNPVYGTWTPITFTLQAVAPAVPTYIASLALADNVGPSSSALVSTDGAIMGTIAAPPGSTASVSGVGVQIDLNGDGAPDATVTTDSSGNFSYTPPAGSLPQGVVKIAVRTADEAAVANGGVVGGSPDPSTGGGVGGGSPAPTPPPATTGVGTVSDDGSNGDWTSLSFVVSSAPTSSTVQSQAQTLATNLAAAAQAVSNNQTTTTAAANTLTSAQATAAATYNTALAQAAAAQQSSAATAAGNYNAALAAAQQTYNSAMSQAAANYGSAITPYSGDTTSYAYQPYVWPDAPPALPDPDETPATPPVPAPTFDGPEFDPTQDPAYQSAIESDQQAYDTAVQGANDTYNNSVTTAQQQEQTTLYGPGGAQSIEQTAFAAADAAYTQAMNVANPTNVTAAAATLASNDQAAMNTYNNTFITANLTYLSAISAADGIYAGLVNAAIAQQNAAYQAAQAQFNATLLGLYQGKPQINPYDPAAAAEEAAWEQSVMDAYHSFRIALATADVAFAQAVDGAAAGFTTSEDAAQAGHDKLVADALEAEQKTFDSDQVTYQTALAEAQRWARAQRADADDARSKAYDLAQKNFGVAVAKAAQTEADAVAVAAQTRDNDIADALETEQTDDAQALITAAQTFAAAQGSPTTPWGTEQAAFASDEAQYEESDATAQNQMAHADNTAAYNDATAVDAANETRDETIAGDLQTEQDSEAQALDDLLDGQATNDKNRVVNDAGAWQTWNDDQADADDTFNKSAIGHAQARNDAEAAAQQAFDDATAQEALDWVIDWFSYPPALQAEIAADQAAYVAAVAGACDDYAHNLAGDNQTRGQTLSADQETYTDSLAGDLAGWSEQNDTLLGADEISVGTALALQDKNDTAARDTADETAAAQAADEVDTDAGDAQTYFDADAGFQKTQDVNDSEAQQTFEDTVADNYSNALQAWAQSSNSPSAAEQAAQAAADDTWVHTVTAAELTDVEDEDAAQVTWSTQVDAAAKLQMVDDAAAVAGAIELADAADAQYASDADTAWTTEVTGLAGAATGYDQASASDSETLANSDAAGYRTVCDAYGTATATYLKAAADALKAVQITGDGDAYHTAMTTANVNLQNSLAGDNVAWANTSAGDQQTFVTNLSNDKVSWVKGMTNAEAGYVASAATAGATETKSDAQLVANERGTEATDQSNLKISIAQANTQLVSGKGTADGAREHAEADADATDQVAYAQADATYQESVASSWASALSQAATSSPSPLASYYAAVAQAQSQEVTPDETQVLKEVNAVTQANVVLADALESTSVTKANAAANAVQTQTATYAPQDAASKTQSENNVAQATGKDADAAAAYQTSVSKAIAQFYQDKASATAADDQAVAAAAVTDAATIQPDLSKYYVELNTNSQTLENITADEQAAAATYNASVHSAWLTEIGGYGDAEITEAKSIGAAEVTLATADGGDEVNLANEQSGVASTLAAQGAQADEALVNTVSSANATEVADIAADVGTWTSSAGTAEEALLSGIGADEADLAGKMSGAEADFAIANAQTQAALAASLAQNSPSGDAAFQSLYAQGYVQWLTDLKSSFVADATTMAKDDAQKRESLEGVMVTLANARAAAESNLMSANGTTSTQTSNALATAEDTYQTQVATGVGQGMAAGAAADSTQEIALANAASTYIVANAQADKTAQLNYDNNVANWQKTYNEQLADANLALADSQADADLAWIKSGAQAIESFQTSDAANWQAMISSEAQASDQFSRQNDAATQAESDALITASADTMTPEAQADQTQANGDAAAAASFRIAEANETETIWNWLAGQLGYTPWAQSQAGLASAEASWATTAATNYQTYVSALGSDKVAYVTSNSAQFVTEMTTIDATDRADSDKLADAQQTLLNALAGDEATFEQTLATASQTYQNALAEADHDCRYAIAQAAHDLVYNGDAAAYAAAMATASANKSNAADAAVAAFESTVAPAMTTQATGDANAWQAEATSEADLTLDDALTADQAIHDYTYAEAADFNVQQKADAQALHDYLVADANGHAAAVASFDQASPSPWADLASSQAADQAAQQIAAAVAQLAQAQTAADAQEAADQAAADAQKTKDDANAQAAHTQSITTAQAAHDAAVAQGDVSDAVFALLAAALTPPDDGTAPILTPDFKQLYEANDFVLQQYAGYFWQTGQFLGGGNKWTDAPNFMAGVSLLGPAVYDWQGYTSQVPLAPVAAGPSGWTPSSGDVSFASTSVVYGGGGQTYSNPTPFKLQDILRADLLPIPAIYTAPMHFIAPAAALLLTAPVAQGAGKVDRSGDSWFSRMFETKFPDKPAQRPSFSGGAQGPPAEAEDPTGRTIDNVDDRGAMTWKSGDENGHQRVKGSILAGNFTTAIYEGIADILEDQIWNLATAGILGEAEGELVQAVAGKTWRYGKDIIKVTIGKITKRVEPDDVAKIQRILKDHGKPHSVEDAAAAIREFGQHNLKHAVDEIVEKMCFAHDTLVSTGRGAKRIGDVHPGEFVYAYDFASGRWVLAEVLRRHDNSYTGWMFTLIAGNSRIEITANHPVWVVEGAGLPERTIPGDLARGEDEGRSLSGRWVNSHELRPGDVFISRDGERRRLDAVESRFEDSFGVCNLTVRGHHTFAVGEAAILVHNTAWCTTLDKFLHLQPAKDNLKNIAKSLGLKPSRVHAHHIVMQKPRWHFDAKTRKELEESKRILSDVGIDLFDGTDAANLARKGGPLDAVDDFAKRANTGNIQNMAWAINNFDDIHQVKYVHAVYERLKAAKAKGRIGVEKALEQMRQELQRNDQFWNR